MAPSAAGEISADLLDPVPSPFTSLVLITPILLASDGLFPQAAMPGRVMTDVFIALTVLLGGWFIGQWFVEPLDLDRFHPGYFLPTVAGSLVASQGAALVGQQRLAEVLLGFGVISWIVVGSLIMGRLFFRPLLPPPCSRRWPSRWRPRRSPAWPGSPSTAPASTWSRLLGGYGILMVIAQLRLLPAYLRLTFMPSMWAFTFSWAAVAAAAIIWLQSAPPPGYRVWQYVLIAAVTALIGGIAIRTVIAISRHQLLPHQHAAPAAQPVSPDPPTR